VPQLVMRCSGGATGAPPASMRNRSSEAANASPQCARN
jgi:hypothetical protein